jgi:Family of unknown function (DUF6624)
MRAAVSTHSSGLLLAIAVLLLSLPGACATTGAPSTQISTGDLTEGRVDPIATSLWSLAGEPRASERAELHQWITSQRQQLATEDPLSSGPHYAKVWSIIYGLNAVEVASSAEEYVRARAAATAIMSAWRREANAAARRAGGATPSERQFNALVARSRIWVQAGNDMESAGYDVPTLALLRGGAIQEGAVVAADARRALLDLTSTGWIDPRSRGTATEENAWFLLETPSQFDAFKIVMLGRLHPLVETGQIDRARYAISRMRMGPLPWDSSDPRALFNEFRLDREAVLRYQAGLAAPRSAGEELKRMADIDQLWRTAISRAQRVAASSEQSDAEWALFQPIATADDHRNTNRLKEMLSQRPGWFDDARDGTRASENAWLIAQHADDDPTFQRLVLDRIAPLVPLRRIRGESYALLWDRVAVHENRPQRYGSQLECVNGVRQAMVGVEDTEHLDERRQSVGLQSWSAYKDMMDRNAGTCRAR